MNVFNKGILGVAKAVSLATKGIIDLVSQPCPRPFGNVSRHRVKLFKIKYKIFGLKLFYVEQLFKIKGKMINTLKGITFKVKGFKSSSLVNKQSIIGKKIYCSSTRVACFGIVKDQFQSILGLKGKSLNQLKNTFIIAGKQKYLLDQIEKHNKLNISGNKKIETKQSLLCNGKRNIKTDANVDIQGKKSFINYLVALDMI
jgi:hypothetical protein